MNKTILILFLFFTSTLFAQEKKLQQYIGWKANDVELNTVSNKQQSCTFVKSSDSIKAFLLNSNGELTDQFAISLQPKEIFRGAFIKDGKVYLFLHNEKMHGFHTWVFNTNDKSVKDNVLEFAIQKQEKRVHRLNSDNYYFDFTVNKKTKEFIIYRFTDETHFDRFSYPVSDETLSAIIDQGLFSESFSIEKVDMEGECDVDVAKSPNKIYVANDTLYLLIDSNYKRTNVYTFDLINKNISFRSINHTVKMPPGITYTNNSFLAAGKLYYIVANSDSLWLQVIDFYSGAVLKQYSAGGHEEISFKNTPITQESSTVFNIPTNRELSKTKQLLRKMLNGASVIIAMPDSIPGRTDIMVGSYKKVSSPGGGGGMMMGVGAGGMPVFIPTGGFSGGTWVKSAHFKMLIDNETNEQIPGNISQSINDRIDNYTANIKISEGDDNLFRHGANYYYAYYNKDKLKLVIVKF